MMPGEIVRKKTTKGTHDSHPNHEFELKNYQKPYRCNGCLEHGYGPRYRCDLCDFDLHEECMFTTHTTEMVLESWKNRPEDTNCLALENLKLELPLQANLFRRRRRGSKYLRMGKFLATILAVLLGDPTIALTSLFVELLSK